MNHSLPDVIMALRILVDRGVIALDDPINDHLPFEVHNPLGDRDVTVRDLLTHRSGLSGGGAKGVWDKPVPLEQALKASYDSDDGGRRDTRGPSSA